MNGRRAVIGICMVCALAFSAVAAQGASAATTGTTAFTCFKLPSPGTAGFKDAHCKEAVTKEAAYVHRAFTGKTSITLTNAETGPETKTAVPTKLKSVSSGFELELESPEVTGEGTMENLTSGTEPNILHFVKGFGFIHYKKAVVTKPSGKGCLVKGGEVVTNELKAETVGEAGGLKFAPASGEEFATFTVEGCSVLALNRAYKVTGTVVGTPEGATTVFTHLGTTEQGTLFLGGATSQKAGIEGKVTIKGPSGAGLALTKPPFTTG